MIIKPVTGTKITLKIASSGIRTSSPMDLSESRGMLGVLIVKMRAATDREQLFGVRGHPWEFALRQGRID